MVNDCLGFTEDDWNELRGTTVAMVFQDPMTLFESYQ